MSGGVGPTCDIGLPKASLEVPEASTRPSLFTLRQLNSLAVVIVLSASGMVSSQEVGMVLFSMFYIYFISAVAFPPTSDRPEPPQKNWLLSAYHLAGAVIGLFLPIGYILHRIVEGDTEGIKAAAPHVFLLASQVFIEGLSFSGRFSPPIRALVPVFFNSVRILTILQWVTTEVANAAEKGYRGTTRRLSVGKALSFLNLAFWSFNLFAFLLPFYLPKAFKNYYAKIKD